MADAFKNVCDLAEQAISRIADLEQQNAELQDKLSKAASAVTPVGPSSQAVDMAIDSLLKTGSINTDQVPAVRKALTTDPDAGLRALQGFAEAQLQEKQASAEQQWNYGSLVGSDTVTSAPEQDVYTLVARSLGLTNN